MIVRIGMSKILAIVVGSGKKLLMREQTPSFALVLLWTSLVGGFSDTLAE
jgi:hypothetical protein